MKPLTWGRWRLPLGERTVLMGILNVTPDSFADGGRWFLVDQAVAHGLQLVEEGADILDIGGESTRPGARPVGAQEELQRILPVVEALAKETSVPISIDTSKGEVARKALAAGAAMINDVTGLRGDPDVLAAAAEFGVPVVAMHMKGDPRTMQANPRYGDLIGEIREYLGHSVEMAEKAGIPKERVFIDPGIGFGKTPAHNYEIIRHMGELKDLGCPILAGPSRKSFLSAAFHLPVEERFEGTAAAVTACILFGAHVVRVHDVARIRRVAAVADAILRGLPEVAIGK